MLSTIKGTSIFLATFENLLKSKIFTDGLPIVSPNTILVLSLVSFKISSSDASGETKVVSIPNFFKVDERRLNVPPYKFEEASIWSPALQMFKTANVVALCPEETATAPTPPSNCAIFLQKQPLLDYLFLYTYVLPL